MPSRATADETEWTSLNVNIKAEAYEGLLEKAASEGKKGAGQYFTPRVLIKSICKVMKPDPRHSRDFSVCDPACGTGEFLVSAYQWLTTPADKGGAGSAAMDRDLAKCVRQKTYFGQDLVARPRRLALMDCLLHGLEADIRLGDSIYEEPDSRRFDVVLTNPPFGTKGANQAPTRDNCLFADQAGEVFEILTRDCRLHTVLRLPRGTFTPYSQGVKANVVFFTKDGATRETWIYDARTNVPGITKKDRPLTPAHFAEFVACYGADPDARRKRKAEDSKEYRWRKFDVAEVKARDFKLDGFKWLKEESLEDADDLGEPEELATDAIAELTAAVEELNGALALLENGNGK